MIQYRWHIAHRTDCRPPPSPHDVSPLRNASVAPRQTIDAKIAARAIPDFSRLADQLPPPPLKDSSRSKTGCRQPEVLARKPPLVFCGTLLRREGTPMQPAPLAERTSCVASSAIKPGALGGTINQAAKRPLCRSTQLCIVAHRPCNPSRGRHFGLRSRQAFQRTPAAEPRPDSGALLSSAPAAGRAHDSSWRDLLRRSCEWLGFHGPARARSAVRRSGRNP